MQIFRNRQLVIKPGFYIFLAFFLLLFPTQWVIAWFISAIFHELCHCIALSVCHVRIVSVSVDVMGAEIETEAMSSFQELIAALAGPVGGLCLLVLSHWIPHIAICGLFQSAYNLLPVYPLDGGRALRCFITLFASVEGAAKIFSFLQSLILAVLFVLAGIAAFVWNLGPIPFIWSILLIVRSTNIKFPCKRTEQIVQ